MVVLLLLACVNIQCPREGNCSSPADSPNQGTWTSTNSDEAEMTIEGDTVTIVYTDVDDNRWEATYRR